MTEKLFDDGMLFSFSAVVTQCNETQNGFEAVLDRSAFFPEGGGQAGDVGTLGGVEVIDTYEKNGEVVHLCKSPLEVGAEVRGNIDENIRIRRMQNHSGEHLLMGFIHNKLGYENVGFHMGSEEVLLDLNGVISPEDIRECEQRANEAIARNIPITISYPDSGTLAALEYRSKLEMTENVRIVTIEGIDNCACCAPHMPTTGGIGIVKVISSESNRGGTRLHILSGLDALDLIRKRMESNAAISHLLSAKPEKTADAVEKLLNENIALKRQITENERHAAEEIISGLKNDSRKSFCIFTRGLGRNTMREIANQAVKLTDGLAAVFSEEQGGFGYIIASEKLPLRTMARDINSALGGKGGGSDLMIQGSLTAKRGEIEEYFSGLDK
ncbi:alanyl-tRNA editing protein [Ruminococcus albus]|uniref:Alanyl-tRNA synthetase n=1 Tax=Ruminococcus albus TaxID=1264 RepID=A0A1H7LYX9_RUMAL|nr:alanine--tRNA ligase-related protein [Ruminococcus albus]SEL03685.1 alanyl-tRNA synthetase [Ruminococcus albus]